MKTYYGMKSEGTCRVRVVDDAQEMHAYDLPARPDLFSRAAEPFNWGSHGRGTAHLAIAILADLLGDADRTVIRGGVPFFRRFFANLSADGFEITETIFRAMVSASGGMHPSALADDAGRTPVERTVAVRVAREGQTQGGAL